MAETPAQLHAEVEKYERKHAENPEGRNFVPLANAYRKMGEFGLAEHLLREGLRLHPDYLSAHIVLGRTLADRGAPEEAAAEFQHVLGIDPQNLIALRTLGELAAGEGRRDEAEHWYRELLAVDPMNEEARRALADLEAPAAGGEAFEAGTGWWTSDEQANHALDAGAEHADAREDGGWAADGASAPLAVEPAAQADGSGSDADGELEDIRTASATDGQWDEQEAAAADPEAEATKRFAAGRDADEHLVVDFVGVGPEAPWSDEETSGPQAVGDPLFPDAPEGAEPSVVHDELASETLAELYARQGFPDEAAEVYRELIRRRGEEEPLLRRLAELEALAAHATGEPTPPLEPAPDAVVGYSPGQAIAVAPADPFADSFTGGFPGEPGHDGLAAPASFAIASPADEPPLSDAHGGDRESGDPHRDAYPIDGFELTERVDAGDTAAGEEVGAGEAGAEEPPTVASAPPASVAEYFARLLAWRPAAAVGRADAAPVEADDVPISREEVEPSTASPRAPSSEEAAEPATGGAAGPDDDRFPWELEEATTSDPSRGEAPRYEAPPEPPSADEPRPESLSTSALFEEVDDLSPAKGSSTEARQETERAPLPFASAPAEEDDDLESFQAWLRSLKR